MNGLLIFLFFVTVSTLSYMLGYHTRMKKDKPPQNTIDIKKYKGATVNDFKLQKRKYYYICECNLKYRGKFEKVEFILFDEEGECIYNQFLDVLYEKINSYSCVK